MPTPDGRPAASISAREVHDAVHSAVRDAVAGLSVHLDPDELKGAVRQAVDKAIDERHLGMAEPTPTAREVAAAVSAVMPTPAAIAREVVERLRSDDELLERLSGPDPRLPPTAEEVATRVLGRLPVVPTAQQVAERVVDALPENPPSPSAAEIAAAVAAVLEASPPRHELLDGLDSVGIELDPGTLAEAIGPLLPTAESVAEALRPELERGWATVEQHVTTRLIEAPSAAEVDELRTDARELRELLRSSRLSFTALHDELTGSARRSREQIDELAAQLTDDLHRWNRTIEERLSKLAASGGTIAQMERPGTVTPPS